MRLSTSWLFLSLLTCVGLLYTHSQVRLVHQSYVLNERLERRDTLHDQYTYVAYDVMMLTAPNRLKERLMAYKVELKAPAATETLTPLIPTEAHSTRHWMPQWLHAIEAEATAE